MQKYEAAHDYRHPAYEKAAEEFYKRHLCRLWPWPDPYVRTVKNLDGNQVYETMNGPNEFMVIGNLKTWDRVDRLGEIQAQTLVTVGKYDELSPTCAETLRQGIAGSRVVQFEHSSHTAHLEETEHIWPSSGRSWPTRTRAMKWRIRTRWSATGGAAICSRRMSACRHAGRLLDHVHQNPPHRWSRPPT